MLSERLHSSIPFVIPLIIFIFLASTVYDWNEFASAPSDQILLLDDDLSKPISNGGSPTAEAYVDSKVYHEVYSNSTAGGKYFMINFVDEKAINPNIIPHPFVKDAWVIVAQRHDPSARPPRIFVQLGCIGTFQNGTLRCMDKPVALPIPATSGDKCQGDLEFFNLSQGPHDARVFYGPTGPYIVYGSNSMFTCFGQVVQEFSSLMSWGEDTFPDTEFKKQTEIQRPPYGPIEKNWFLFWDKDGELYAHYGVTPKRVFAKLSIDGSVGEDLAPQAAPSDEKCMAKYMPKVGPELESTHQATNSLSITLCRRADPSCEPNDLNTFILTIFQFKSYYFFHSVYEPYAIVFQQKAPFKVHGISKKPIWVHGRGKPNEEKDPKALKKRRPLNFTEMFYITSISWKAHGQKYHGYSDDVLFISFGIEDSKTGGIDVVAGDLLMDIGLCSYE